MSARIIFLAILAVLSGCNRPEQNISGPLKQRGYDRYYQIIDHRCTKTEIGRTDIAKHRFVDQEGPWSAAEQRAYQMFNKEIGR